MNTGTQPRRQSTSPLRRYAPLLWFLIAALVVFGTAARVSPFYSLLLGNYGGNAASDAMLIGKYWLTGAVPYRDFYALGGPLYFAVQALGWALGGRTGVAVLETVNLGVFLLLTERLLRRYLRRSHAALLTLFAALLTAALSSGGDSAQEWGLSLTAAALLLLLPKWEASARVPRTERRRAFLLGLLLGAALLLDSGGCVLLACGALYALFRTGKRDGAGEALRRLGLGALGGAVIVLPFAVCFAANGALGLLFEAAFLIPLQIWLGGFAADANMLHKCVKCAMLLAALLPGLLSGRKERREDCRALFWMACGCLAVLLGGEISWYRYLEAVPCVTVGIALLGTRVRRGRLAAGGVLLACALCAVPCKSYVQFLYTGVADVIYEFAEDLESFCENNSEGTFWMEDTDTSYYLEQDLRPLHPYFTDQSTLSEYSEEILSAIEEYRAGVPDILLTTQHGWHDQGFDGFVLVQVYLMNHNDNLCIYQHYVSGDDEAESDPQDDAQDTEQDETQSDPQDE